MGGAISDSEHGQGKSAAIKVADIAIGGELPVFGPNHWGEGGLAVVPSIAPPPLAAFLTAAHELRAPLAWLLGEAESLHDQSTGPLNPVQLQTTREIAQTCVHMQRIVEDCFAYGRLESGEMPFRADVADMDAHLRDLAAAWELAFAKKGVALRATTKGTLQPFPCDPHKLLRVISNLMENALKFTPSGGAVELLWQPCIWDRGEGGEAGAGAGAEGRANAVCISVSDNGPGVAPENQQEIFEPFVRLDRGDSGGLGAAPGAGTYRRRREDVAPGLGLGLGLAVARRLIQWHGGKIWVESEPQRGCTFAVMLPLFPAD